MKNEMEERLTNIEMKLAYLEDFLNQLQEVAVENSKTIERLENENKYLSERMKDVSEFLEGDIPNRKPPHY
ncbi:MAG: SlyX family protein [Treponemataceae bacterium]|nr:SlyX family protein [Spirochaetales bacterium]MDY6031803.1 SlyX family protein [Treponemataceae bacterium]